MEDEDPGRSRHAAQCPHEAVDYGADADDDQGSTDRLEAEVQASCSPRSTESRTSSYFAPPPART
jgi:hypothetical protein